jgi:hypothetical protein
MRICANPAEILDNRDHLTLFDLDQQVRQALLEDLSSKPAGNYDALLLTGDIAFGGNKEEYAVARTFLDEVLRRLVWPRDKQSWFHGTMM